MARNYRDIDRIIQSCLEAIENGGESIDSAISRYPDLEESLRPPLEAALWLHRVKSNLDPRPKFVSSSRQRLVAQIQRDTVVKAPTQGFTLRDIFASLGRRELALQFALAVLILIFLVVGTGSVALAARNAIPGDNLYAVKITQERVRLALSFTRVGDARLHAEFALDRIIEIQRLVLEERFEFLDEAFARFEREVAQAIELTQEVAEQENPEAVVLAVQMGEILSSQKLVLTTLSGQAPQEIEDDIAHALDLTEEGLLAVEVIKDTLTGIERPTLTPAPTRTPTVFKTRTPTPSPSPTEVPESILGLTPTGTYQPAIEQTSSPGSAPEPTQVSRPTKPPTATPTNTPKPTKVKPKPTNTHRPTARPTNPNRPDKDKDD